MIFWNAWKMNPWGVQIFTAFLVWQRRGRPQKNIREKIERLKTKSKARKHNKIEAPWLQQYSVPFYFSQQDGNRLAVNQLRKPLLNYNEAVENNSLHLHIVEAYGDGVYLSQIKCKSVYSFSSIKRYVIEPHLWIVGGKLTIKFAFIRWRIILINRP